MNIKNKYLIVGGILFLLVIFYLVGFKVHFLHSEELLVDLDPVEQHVRATNGEVVELTFTVDTNTHPACKTQCSSLLFDETTGRELYDGDTIPEQTFDIRLDREYAGTSLYRYVVSCSNQRTALCSSAEEVHKKTSYITITHNLTSEQEASFQSFKQELQEAGAALLSAQATIDAIDPVELGTIEPGLVDAHSELQRDLRAQQNALQRAIDAYTSFSFNSYSPNLQQYDTFIEALTKIQQSQTIIQELLSIDPVLLTRATHYANISLEPLQNISYQTEYVLLRAQIYDAINEYNATRDEQFSLLQQNISRVTNTTLSCTNYLVLTSTVETFNENLIQERNTLFPSLNGSLPETENYVDPQTNETFTTEYFPVQANFTTLNDLCIPAQQFTQINPFTFSVELINVTIPDQEPQCCLDGNCIACGSAKKNPVLFVHGHAFSRNHAPDNSISALGGLQQALPTHIDAGQLTTNSNFGEMQNVWGLFEKPVAVRASYYYVVYNEFGNQVLATQKRDSIENYAIRLKELIDEILLRSGAEQVDIVAHSMGGLVSRQYVALFGEDKVGTLIMIGTPNNGVEGAVDTFCAVTGARKECNEMKQGSIFLQRLNTYEPQTTPYITIAGQGCDMNGPKGDGIVTAESVQLPYATNYLINGTCNDFLQTELHRDIVDPKIHPEVLDIILEHLHPDQ